MLRWLAFLALCASGHAWFNHKNLGAPRTFGRVSRQRWGDFGGLDVQVSSVGFLEQPVFLNVEATSVVDVSTRVFASLGDLSDRPPTREELEDMKRRHAFNLRVGTAMETLRRELPLVFAMTNFDFSIFSQQITVVDQRQNKAVMPKSLYIAAVKSLRMAAAISSMYPSMNVKKIEFVEEERMIQCLVDVVLPDAVRIDGQAVWEGMFFFGLDEEGLINSHVFDRKVTTAGRAPLSAAAMNLPWLRSSPQWTPGLISEPVFSMECAGDHDEA